MQKGVGRILHGRLFPTKVTLELSQIYGDGVRLDSGW